MTHETKPCDICGRETPDGMTDDYGEIHVCEKCFEKYMDDTYGKHCWMTVNDDGCGGYYIVKDDTVVGGYIGTGIYYTTFEWED